MHWLSSDSTNLWHCWGILFCLQNHTWMLIRYLQFWPDFWLLDGRNPLYLAVIFVVFLVGKAIWVQLDIATEFQNGFVSIQITILLFYFLKPPNGFADWYRYACNVTQLLAILSLSTKFVPAIMNILKRLADEGQGPAASDRQREVELQPTYRSSYRSVTSAGSSSVTATENGPEYSSQWQNDFLHLCFLGEYLS